MAIQQNLIKKEQGFSGELVYPNAYWKVEKIVYTNGKIDADVCAYTKKNEACISRMVASLTPSLDGANFIRQTYEYLKALPEFANGTDC